MFSELQYACSENFSILSLRSGSFKRTISDLRVRKQATGRPAGEGQFDESLWAHDLQSLETLSE